jgi:hypothetical protein
MTLAQLARAGKPFHTTKTRGLGTVGDRDLVVVSLQIDQDVAGQDFFVLDDQDGV